MRRLRLQGVGRAVVVASVLTSLLAVGGVAGASKLPPSYPLGSAKRCRAHYVKRTRVHKVRGKLVRYVACVYDAPRPKPTTTTTAPSVRATETTVTSSVIPASTGDGYDVSISPVVSGPGFLQPATGTLVITITDSITGQKVGSWVNSGGYSAQVAQPPLEVTVSPDQPPELLLDSSLGVYWSGPSLEPISLADFEAHAFVATASFSGMPGFAPSASSGAPL